MKLLSTAPTRVSLFGGSTDIPTYSNLYGGLVISMGINLRVTSEIFTDEDTFKTRNEIPPRGSLEFIHKVLSAFDRNSGQHDFGNFRNIRFVIKSDALLESGLGTSGATIVSIVGAINKIEKLGLSKGEIAEKSWSIEVNNCGLYSGKQDVYASAFGGFNAITFEKDKIEVLPLKTTMIMQLMPSLVLVHTNKIRINPKIQEGFKKLDSERIAKLTELKDLATSAFISLDEGDIEAIGALLDQSWQIKKQTNRGVSTPELDNIYQNAKHYGAFGGKGLGSGGGGYMLFIVDPNKREVFIENIEREGVELWDFSLSNDGVETRIL